MTNITHYLREWCLSPQLIHSVMSDSDPTDCSMPGFPVHHHSLSLLKLTSFELVMSSNHLILFHPLFLLPSIFPASGSFPKCQFFASGGQSIGVSASTSVLPMNPFGWTGWVSLQSKELSRVFSNTTVQKHHSSALSFLYSPTLTSILDYWKNHSFG